MTDLENPSVQREYDRQMAIISRHCVDLLPADEFERKLKRSISSGVPLRIKQGFDPTSPDIHIGHAVGIRKLKALQEIGHQIVLIVGDFTAMVGDPSGVSTTRPRLSYDDVMANAETYQEQFFRILDRDKTEVRFNGEWFREMSFDKIMELASTFTVARLLEREDFSSRYSRQVPISIHELFYPLMQGYDSVAILADLELGATEQRFNLLVGRTIQEAYGVEPQAIMTLPILVGVDGEKKMSKSLGNYIGITEPPREIFGKVMSIPDNLIVSYFELATNATSDEIEQIKSQLNDSSVNPMTVKKKLGETLVDLYHNPGDGAEARQEFERVFSKGQLPDEMPEIDRSGLRNIDIDPTRIYLVHLMTRQGMVQSNSEARKLIAAGGVSLNGDRITDVDHEFSLDQETILKVGKRRFLRLKL